MALYTAVYCLDLSLLYCKSSLIEESAECKNVNVHFFASYFSSVKWCESCIVITVIMCLCRRSRRPWLKTCWRSSRRFWPNWARRLKERISAPACRAPACSQTWSPLRWAVCHCVNGLRRRVRSEGYDNTAFWSQKWASPRLSCSADVQHLVWFVSWQQITVSPVTRNSLSVRLISSKLCDRILTAVIPCSCASLLWVNSELN